MKPFLIAIAIGGLLLVYVYLRPRQELVYSVSVRQALADQSNQRKLRVDGVVVPGSLCKFKGQCGIRFRLAEHAEAESSSDATLGVLYPSCGFHEPIRYDIGNRPLLVSVEGQFETTSQFSATKALVKLGGKYSDPDPADRPLLTLPDCDR